MKLLPKKFSTGRLLSGFGFKDILGLPFITERPIHLRAVATQRVNFAV